MTNVLTYMDKRSISDWSYKHLITLQSLTDELVWPTMFSVNLVLNEDQYPFETTLEMNFKLAHNYFRLTFYTVFSSIVHSVNTHEATIGIVHLDQKKKKLSKNYHSSVTLLLMTTHSRLIDMSQISRRAKYSRIQSRWYFVINNV